MAEIKVIYQDFVGTQIWEHFRRSTCGKLAQCKLCKKTLKCEGGSTKGLHMHIRSIHQIEVLKRNITNETNMELSKQPKQPNISAVRTLDYYINDTSLPAILARMTACDGLSFNVFTTSLDIRRSISALGHSIPKSVSGVRDQVVKYGQQLREEVKRSIHISKSKGAYFSLTLDEWTSVQNKRYLNINIHGNDSFWNLGLIRIRGRFSSEACSNVIVHKLNEFGVNFEKDIVAITTDGCSMMKKLGRSIASLHQLCYAHGLQLVIQDTFYQKHNEDIEIFSDGSGTDDEDNTTALDDDCDDDDGGVSYFRASRLYKCSFIKCGYY